MPDYRRSPEEAARSMAAAKALKAKETLKEQKSKIKSARIALLVVGILQCGVGLIEVLALDMPWLALAIDGGIGLVFIGLYFYSSENPKGAFMAGLILYLLIHVLVAVFDPTTLFKGIIMKAIIISVLVGGLNAIRRIPASLLAKKDSDELLDNEQAVTEL